MDYCQWEKMHFILQQKLLYEEKGRERAILVVIYAHIAPFISA